MPCLTTRSAVSNWSTRLLTTPIATSRPMTAQFGRDWVLRLMLPRIAQRVEIAGRLHGRYVHAGIGGWRRLPFRFEPTVATGIQSPADVAFKEGSPTSREPSPNVLQR